MKTLLTLAAAALLCACDPAPAGNRTPHGEPSKDGTNTGASGIPKGDETPPSSRTGYPGTGAGVDKPDDPSKPQPPPLPNDASTKESQK